MNGCESDSPLEPADENVLVAISGTSSTAPTGVTATAVSTSRIDVSWQDNSTNETGFEVYRATAPATVPVALLATTTADVIGYGDVGLTGSTGYCYRVRSFRVSGRKTSYSTFSSTACSTTPAPPPPPEPPLAPWFLDAWPNGSTEVLVLWRVDATTEDGFRVERSLDAGATWTTASVQAPDNTQMFDHGRTPEALLCYRVIAFNTHGDSPPSDVDCTTPPARPTNLVASEIDPVTGVFELAWTDNSAVEDAYQVIFCTTADGSYFCGHVDWLPANSTSYQIQWDGSLNTYSVVAVKDGGASDTSNEVAPVPPTAGLVIMPVTSLWNGAPHRTFRKTRGAS